MKLDKNQKEKVLKSLQMRLEKALEAGERLSWNSFLTHIGGFINPSTKNTYKGMLNGILLSVTAMAFEGEHRFIGFAQARKMGGSVKKGEKSTTIFRPMTVDKEDSNGNKSKAMIGFRPVSVFNVKQTKLIENGIVPETVEENVNTDSAPISSVMDFFSNIDFEQVKSTACPYYSPLANNIGMPPFEAFHNSFKHAESLCHEMIHWTGHENRLGRLRNKQTYSKEELTACLGASLLLNHLGVEASEEMEVNQTAYLQGWISNLKNDIEMLLEAAQDAVTACNYLIKLAEGKSEEQAAA